MGGIWGQWGDEAQGRIKDVFDITDLSDWGPEMGNTGKERTRRGTAQCCLGHVACGADVLMRSVAGTGLLFLELGHGFMAWVQLD